MHGDEEFGANQFGPAQDNFLDDLNLEEFRFVFVEEEKFLINLIYIHTVRTIAWF